MIFFVFFLFGFGFEVFFVMVVFEGFFFVVILFMNGEIGLMKEIFVVFGIFERFFIGSYFFV